MSAAKSFVAKKGGMITQRVAVQRYRAGVGPEEAMSESEEEEELKEQMIKIGDMQVNEHIERFEDVSVVCRERIVTRPAEAEEFEAFQVESEEEENETDESESEEEKDRLLLKPVFMSKQQRHDPFVKIQKDDFMIQKKANERIKETQIRVAEEIKREMKVKLELEELGLSLADVDDTDLPGDDLEYHSWKLREFQRIKRDTEERDRIIQEQLEIERRRSLTEEERKAEDEAYWAENTREKGQYRFLQKYYHKGAFFQDEDTELYKRDYSEATGEDQADRTILPEVMQVRNYGKAGRSKYTHLVDQDTTGNPRETSWAEDNSITKRTISMMGGMKEFPGKRKKA